MEGQVLASHINKHGELVKYFRNPTRHEPIQVNYLPGFKKAKRAARRVQKLSRRINRK